MYSSTYTNTHAHAHTQKHLCVDLKSLCASLTQAHKNVQLQKHLKQCLHNKLKVRSVFSSGASSQRINSGHVCVCDWACEVCFGPTLSGLEPHSLDPVCVTPQSPVCTFSQFHYQRGGRPHANECGVQLIQITDLFKVTQKVHIPPKPQSSDQELLWIVLGVPRLIRRQLLLVGNVIVSWRPRPVKETTLWESHEPISVIVDN